MIGQTTSSHVSGFSGTFAGTAYEGQNLLTHTLAGALAGTGVSAAFVLDTSGFGNGGFSLSGANSNTFSLEFISAGSGDNLVLDYNSAPEPGTTLLVTAGAGPLLLRRRRAAGSGEAA